LRIKFNAANHNPSGTYVGLWQIGDPNSKKIVQYPPMPGLAPDTFHEFPIPPDLYNDKGVLTIVFLNENNSSLLFPLEDGMEVLYPQDSFTLNFLRALGIIFCWLLLLSSIGLMAASFLSFPVAAFFSMAMLALAFSSGTLADSIGMDNPAPPPGAAAPQSLGDMITTPFFKGIVNVLNLVENFSPIDSLSTGRSIPWSELGAAFAQIVLLLGGIFIVAGIFFFSRRELATAQTQ
jgi:hypothetical protein